MVNQDIVKYLREGIKRGFSVSLLRQKLLEGGFSEEDISEAVTFLHSSAHQEKPAPQTNPVQQTHPPQHSASPQNQTSSEANASKSPPPSGQPAREKRPKKWMKIAAWCGVMLIVISFIYSLLVSFLPEAVGNNLALLIAMAVISILLMLTYLFGFLKMSKRCEDTLLKVGSILLMVTVVLTPVALFLISNALASMATSGTNDGAGIAIASLGIITLLVIVSKSFFSIGLMKVGKEVRFSKGAGIMALIFTGLFFLISIGFLITASTLAEIATGALAGGDLATELVNAGPMLIVVSLGVLLAFLVKLIAMILEIFTLFEASSTFEKKKDA